MPSTTSKAKSKLSTRKKKKKLKAVKPKKSSIQSILKTFNLQKEKQSQDKVWNLKERRYKLQSLEEAMFRYRKEIHLALREDLSKSSGETDLSEIYVVITHIRYALRHLRRWMRPQKVSTPIPLLGSNSYVYQEPKGVVLILSPWNMPINLTFSPLVSALATGNRVIIKPSEHTPSSSRLMQKIIQEIYKVEDVALFNGGIKTAQELLELPFDHIFFTGSASVGQEVMKKAAQHLSSVTLELGGKSPVIIDESADLKLAALRIVWAKFMNCGQVCISPDYVCIQKNKEEDFVRHLKASFKKLYSNPSDYGSIINTKHKLALSKLVEDAKARGAKLSYLLPGLNGEKSHKGKANKNNKTIRKNFFEALVLRNVATNSKIMQEEIFGPILPIIPFDSLEEAITLVNSKPKALALYVYSKNKKHIKQILTRTRSGGACVNDSIIQFFNINLPFGGVGPSGMGSAHSYFGFQEFSNPKAVLYQKLSWNSVRLLMPPYTKLKRKLIELTMRFI